MIQIIGSGSVADPFLADLISYWKLDEASGGRVDAHSSNDLTDNNSVGSAGGKIGNAGQFSVGGATFLNHTDNAALSTGNIDISVQAWVYLDSKGGDMCFVGKGDASTGFGWEYHLSYRTGIDRFVFSIANGSAEGIATANVFGSPSTATWYHLIGWHDAAADEVGIAVNDGTPNTASFSGGGQDTSLEFTIGRLPNISAWYASARIDEVGFWKRVLSSGERTSLYGGGSGLAYPF